ncbi:hypothetical protein AMTR_s00019p00216530 [Amborella trichopoda]|uniref:Uncharacterized protein n=1 Tax=Amborella trichopoda TaxID=13333 RepID=W1PI43_AMBTC|nr:hypothetical protein AMTR_s00019p00216530 [Amborella trichopoda]
MTPADISEILIKRRRDPKKALEDLKAAMEKRAEQNKERVRNSSSEKVAEEQEKRAFETPKENRLEEEEVSKDEKEKDKDS